jgi:hypothetical protein
MIDIIVKKQIVFDDLLKGYMICVFSKKYPHMEVIDPTNHLNVVYKIPTQLYQQLKEEILLKETLVLEPGCGPSIKLHAIGNEYIEKYAVDIKYVNRSNDPIEF